MEVQPNPSQDSGMIPSSRSRFRFIVHSPENTVLNKVIRRVPSATMKSFPTGATADTGESPPLGMVLWSLPLSHYYPILSVIIPSCPFISHNSLFTIAFNSVGWALRWQRPDIPLWPRHSCCSGSYTDPQGKASPRPHILVLHGEKGWKSCHGRTFWP